MNDKELKSYNEIISSLDNGGEISFDMPSKNKRAMKQCMDRMNKLQVTFGSSSVSGRFYSLIYGGYCGLRQILAVSGNPELDRAITAYQVAWSRIKTIKGEDLPNERIRITFVGRA